MPRFVYSARGAAESAGRSLRASPVVRTYGRFMRDRERLAPPVELVARPVPQDDGRFALVLPEPAAVELRARRDYDEELTDDVATKRV